MIYKRELLEAIGDLDKDLFLLEKKLSDLGARVRVLEMKVEKKAKSKAPAKTAEKPKRGPGRPRKNAK